MPRWADKVNGSVGSFLNYFFVQFGLLIGFIGYFATNDWKRWVIIGFGIFMVLLGSGLLKHLSPKTFKTSSERDDEFNQKRRFGKKRK